MNHVLRAVLFDLDDTLVDQASAAGVAVSAWSTERAAGEFRRLAAPTSQLAPSAVPQPS